MASVEWNDSSRSTRAVDLGRDGATSNRAGDGHGGKHRAPMGPYPCSDTVPSEGADLCLVGPPSTCRSPPSCGCVKGHDHQRNHRFPTASSTLMARSASSWCVTWEMPGLLYKCRCTRGVVDNGEFPCALNGSPPEG